MWTYLGSLFPLFHAGTPDCTYPISFQVRAQVVRKLFDKQKLFDSSEPNLCSPDNASVKSLYLDIYHYHLQILFSERFTEQLSIFSNFVSTLSSIESHESNPPHRTRSSSSVSVVARDLNWVTSPPLLCPFFVRLPWWGSLSVTHSATVTVPAQNWMDPF